MPQMKRFVTLAAALLMSTSCTASDNEERVAPSPEPTQQVLALRLEDHRLQPRGFTDLFIEFPFAYSHTWGLETRVEARSPSGRRPEWQPVFYILTDPDRDDGHPASYYRYGKENTAIPGVGFQSTETLVPFGIVIPPLSPGEYRICKDFTPNHTTDGRFRTVTACDYFKVTRE